MSVATADLRQRADAYRSAVVTLGQARELKDQTKQLRIEREAELLVSGIATGVITGKNAETREAESLILFRADTEWQTLKDNDVEAGSAFLADQDQVALALVDMKVAAFIVNAEIAETGARALLLETSMGVL